MAVSRKTTDQVLASARKELESQLRLIRDEQSRLGAEEQALTLALSSLESDGGSRSPAARADGANRPTRRAQTSTTRSSKRKRAGGARPRRRSAVKSTADRVDELRELLSDGPKSRKALATALDVSPARVQQLLAELGSSVSSQPDPEQRRGKLWRLKGSANGAGATKPAARGGSARSKGSTRRKAPARTKPTSK